MDADKKNLLVKEAKEELDKLLLEDKAAIIAKEKRDKRIEQAQAIIDFLSPSDSHIIINSVASTEARDRLQSSIFEYPIHATWKEKIKSYMKFMNKVITIADIVTAFKPLQTDYNEKKLMGAITNNIAAMGKKGMVKVYKPEIRMKGYFYGNPLWFDGDVLKEEYKPDLTQKLSW